MTIFANRVRVASATTGTGTLTLGAADAGYQSFASAGVPNGSKVRYVIEEGTAWEIGTGVYNAGTLTRTLQASSTGSLLSLGGAERISLSLTSYDVSGRLAVQQAYNLSAIQAQYFLGDTLLTATSVYTTPNAGNILLYPFSRALRYDAVMVEGNTYVDHCIGLIYACDDLGLPSNLLEASASTVISGLTALSLAAARIDAPIWLGVQIETAVGTNLRAGSGSGQSAGGRQTGVNTLNAASTLNYNVGLFINGFGYGSPPDPFPVGSSTILTPASTIGSNAAGVFPQVALRSA